jgi:hypothetical protein
MSNSDSLDYFAWLGKQEAPMHRGRAMSCLPAADCSQPGGSYIGGTWVPDDLEFHEWYEATIEAAADLLSDARFNDVGSLSFNGRALTNTEMAAIVRWQRDSLDGMIDRWIHELYQLLEERHGERVTRIDEDQRSSEDSVAVESAQGESGPDI